MASSITAVVRLVYDDESYSVCERARARAYELLNTPTLDILHGTAGTLVPGSRRMRFATRVKIRSLSGDERKDTCPPSLHAM